VLVPLLAGAAVAVSLGAYGAVHDPSGETITTLGFSGVLNMKVWLTTGVATLALVQLATALRLFGHLGSGAAPGWVAPVHRASGTLAVLLSLPVAYHCLWSLGFQDSSGRVLAHSLLGCAFYGAFAAKVLVVRLHRYPGWVLPTAGGLLFAVLIAVWYTSAIWFLRLAGVGL
jgi:hypothetical protein